MPDTRTLKKIFKWNPLTKNHREDQSTDGRITSNRIFAKLSLKIELDKLTKHENTVNYIKAQRLSWFGHAQRMPDSRTVKKIFKWNPLTKRSQGRPKYRWEG